MMNFLENIYLIIMIGYLILQIFLDQAVFLIFKTKNYLFVDGRYTLQAENQSGKFFKIFTFPKKMPKSYFKGSKKLVIGFDPKIFTKKTLIIFLKKNYKLNH